MPRCLYLHHVSAQARFCAVCGARVVPGWAWVVGALLAALLISMATRWSDGESPVPTAIATAIPPAPSTLSPTPTRIPRSIRTPTRTIVPTQTRTPTTSPIPSITQTATLTLTPTWTATVTHSPTPTATLYPRAALLTYHGRYVIAKDEVFGWSLRQETRKGDPCAWFTINTLVDGRIAVKTCHERYITAPSTGKERADWLLRQESELIECGMFSVVNLGDGKIALLTCAGRYWTAGDWGWEEGLQWSVVAETQILLDWEMFTLETP